MLKTKTKVITRKGFKTIKTQFAYDMNKENYLFALIGLIGELLEKLGEIITLEKVATVCENFADAMRKKAENEQK